MHNDEITAAVQKALKAIDESAPEELLEAVNFFLKNTDVNLDESELVEVMTTSDKNSVERQLFHIALARWDAEGDPDWTETSPNSLARRAAVLAALGFGEAAIATIDQVLPPVLNADDLIQADPSWDPWFTADRRAGRTFYWDAYKKVLAKSIGPDSIGVLDATTTNIVARLADPIAPKPYRARGLVVGHVQSGKTANFTGVVAKSVDAGYRLIIILTGTVELLRAQTQRRLDMELIGEENILGGHDRNDPEAVADVDYIGNADKDWLAKKFVSHGIDFAHHGDVPAVRRLTGMNMDFARLKHGLSALDFRAGKELADPSKPMWDEINLYGTDVRIAVVKKNSHVLKKLVADLGNVKAKLDEIPALIIDDEADQASVNTTNPKKSTAEKTERKAINGHITDLLGKLKRAQYIGYTATPFANVFVSPDDSEDIFPKDFIISLFPPDAYMGGKQFHDLEDLSDEDRADPRISNQKAFVRNLNAVDDDPGGAAGELRTALDSFVLSGAIKLWRQEQNPELDFRHHTMLIHESVKQVEHEELAGIVRAEWNKAAYSEPASIARLKNLYESDFAKVSAVRREADVPAEGFDDIVDHIGTVIDRVMKKGDPVVIVNGAAEKDYEKLDFQTDDVWRVLIGGTKLSRGFTVEGLTISYFRRRALAADSLMQMGRWFGYRRGYRDLVRLYIARNAKPVRGRVVDLYDAFTSIVQDEEAFREQLHQFAELDENGDPKVRPFEVPPLVFQQLPWLKPTAANKMYNAELDFLGKGAQLKDFSQQADRNPKTNRDHFDAVKPWIAALKSEETFEYFDATREKIATFKSRYAVVPAGEVLSAFEKFSWASPDVFEPTRVMIEKAMAEKTLTEWTILLPTLANAVFCEVDGHSVPVSKRNRRSGDRPGFSGSSFRQRHAIEHIAGNTEERGGDAAEKLHHPTMGAVLLTFASDPKDGVSDPTKLPAIGADSGDLATLFSLALPLKSAPRGRIGFRVKSKAHSEAAIIDKSKVDVP